MRILLLITILFSFNTWAQKEVSAQVFQINIRPALNGIVGDFYQMVALFPEFPRELSSIVQEAQSFSSEKVNLLEQCPRRLSRKCLITIKNIEGKLASLQAKTMSMMVHQQIAPTLHISTLSGMRIFSEFQTMLDHIKGDLSNTAMALSAHVKYPKETYEIIKAIDELGTMAALTIVEYVPFEYKEDFRHFYLSFIHPIEQQMTRPKNHEFLNQNVIPLNFAVNLLNMNLTKRNKKTPEGMGPFLNVIHTRWNGILRFYL